MATNFADHVDVMRRAVAVPGTFDDLFPSTTAGDLAALMLDGLAAAQLDGFLNGHSVTDVDEVEPELTRHGLALVVMYSSISLLRNEIRNRRTSVRYEASGNVFQEDQTASLLIELLRQMQADKDRLIEQARVAGLSKAFYMVDSAWVNAVAEYDAGSLPHDFNHSVVRALSRGA